MYKIEQLQCPSCNGTGAVVVDTKLATMEGLKEAIYEYLTSDDLELEISARVAVEISNGLISLLSTHIDQIARENGYVKLDKDQTLPECSLFEPENKDASFWKKAGYLEAQLDMVNKDWRKVIL